jgi:hypothetical protein
MRARFSMRRAAAVPVAAASLLCTTGALANVAAHSFCLPHQPMAQACNQLRGRQSEGI